MSDKRRMFSATVVGSAEFMLMQPLSQVLYMQLCMNADDAGVLNNARIVTRMVAAKEKHLEELCEAGFLIQLETNLHVIRHWFVSNQIRGDRSRDSDYKAKLNEKLYVDDMGIYCNQTAATLRNSADILQQVDNQNAQNRGESAANCCETAAEMQQVDNQNAQIRGEMLQSCNQTAAEMHKTAAEMRQTDNQNAQNRGEMLQNRGESAANCCKTADILQQVDNQNAQNRGDLTTKMRNSAAKESIVKDSIDKDSVEECSIGECSIVQTAADPRQTDNQNAQSCNQNDTQYTHIDTQTASLADNSCLVVDETTTLSSNELEKRAEEIRIKFQDAGVKVPNAASWWVREFKFALESKQMLQLSDVDFFGALENYTMLLQRARASPGVFWWDRKLPIGSLFKSNAGKSPPILRFLPSVFDLQEFKKETRQTSRGIDSASAKYDMKALADKQAAARVDDDAQEAIGF